MAHKVEGCSCRNCGLNAGTIFLQRSSKKRGKQTLLVCKICAPNVVLNTGWTVPGNKV